jgi:hypothetical protein
MKRGLHFRWVGRPRGFKFVTFCSRAATGSVSVNRNWRLTFDIRQGEIRNLDLEDYH